MGHETFAVTILLVSSLGAVTPVFAQPPAAPSTTVRMWNVSAGRESVAVRDIARTGIPVDASPTRWRGQGLSTSLTHSRISGRRTQTFMFASVHAGHFVYDTGLEERARPSEDRFTRLQGSYEYRRRMVSRLWLRGLGLSGGVRIGASHTGLHRAIDGGLKAEESREAADIGLVLAARFDRSRHWMLDVAWGNGAHIGRVTERHSASPEASRHRWGGGWRSDLRIAGIVGLTARVALRADYLRVGDGQLSSHRNLATAHQAFTMGVTYAR